MTIEIVVPGGMSSLKEIPGQENVGKVEDLYFDEFATYAPFKWLGSRRLRPEEVTCITCKKDRKC